MLHNTRRYQELALERTLAWAIRALDEQFALNSCTRSKALPGAIWGGSRRTISF